MSIVARRVAGCVLAVSAVALPPVTVPVYAMSEPAVETHARSVGGTRAATVVGWGENVAISPDGSTVVYRAGHVLGRKVPVPSVGKLMMWRNGKVQTLLTASTDRRDYDPFMNTFVTDRGRHVVFSSFARTLTKEKLTEWWWRCYVWSRATGKVRMLAGGRPCIGTDLTRQGEFYFVANLRSGYKHYVVDITDPTARPRKPRYWSGGKEAFQAVSLDGNWSAYAGGEEELRIQDLDTGKEAVIEAGDEPGSSVDTTFGPIEVSPHGRFVAYVANLWSENADGWTNVVPALRLWDRSTGVTIDLWQGGDADLLRVFGVSDTGRVLYEQDNPQGARVWVKDLGAASRVVAQGPPGLGLTGFTDAGVSRFLFEDQTTRKDLPGRSVDGTSSWLESSNPKVRLLPVP